MKATPCSHATTAAWVACMRSMRVCE
jgi:hypothetical protein